jgi:hypothetical protein
MIKSKYPDLEISHQLYTNVLIFKQKKTNFNCNICGKIHITIDNKISAIIRKNEIEMKCYRDNNK